MKRTVMHHGSHQGFPIKLDPLLVLPTLASDILEGDPTVEFITELKQVMKALDCHAMKNLYRRFDATHINL